MQNICPLVTVLTIAYNTEQYIGQAIESILNQTYKNIQYVLVNNGSTDKTGDIIKQYGEKDNRIKVVWREVNSQLGLMRKMLEKHADGEYFVVLDSDDWFDLNYIERLMNLTLDFNLDISCTGCVFHPMPNGELSERAASQRLVFSRKDFAEMFSYYHVFFRTTWGKLFRTKKFLNGVNKISFSELEISYGVDTLMSFSALRECEKIGVDDTAMYHYRIHKKSVSRQYDPRQSYSDLYLFNDALDFLSPYGPISEDNLFFLHVVYSNAVNDTLNNIKSSALTASEKSEEYYKILERQVTKDCYKRTYEDITNNKVRLFVEVFRAFSELEEIPQKWNEILSFYFPKCHGAISTLSAKLSLTETDLLKGFINDDSISVIKTLCLLLSRNQYTKQFDLPQILCSLSQNHPILSNITDPKFLKNHSDVYLLLYQNKYADALSAMTDTLLKENVNNETFLQTYLNVAALLEQVDEFIFGKIRTADFYLSSKRFEECKEILDDLGEMGVEDNEEIIDMKAKLSEQLS